ncbi:hypothetical protein [Aliivibrio fischeri]|uniref:hypothetical protein n=1 Tax=Aliivibrio fischeri TaxID=668 RepID=UPI000907DC99|nr:hypothetical protein [Aliivibrio fischeri]
MNCKCINILLFFAASILFASTSSASESIDIQPKLSRSGFQSWTIGDARVSVYASCRLIRGDLFQKVGTCSPSIGIYYDGKESVGGSLIVKNSASLYVGKSSLTSRNFLASYESKEIIEALSKGRLAKIITSYRENEADRPMYKSYTVNLIRFNEAVSEAILRARADTTSEVDENNLTVGITVLLLVLIVLVITWYIKTKIVPKMTQTIVQKKQEIRNKSEERQVAKIAKEETIRQTIRQSVLETNDEKINTLKQQIKEALDKDDTKTATILMDILSERENLK